MSIALRCGFSSFLSFCYLSMIWRPTTLFRFSNVVTQGCTITTPLLPFFPSKKKVKTCSYLTTFLLFIPHDTFSLAFLSFSRPCYFLLLPTLLLFSRLTLPDCNPLSLNRHFLTSPFYYLMVSFWFLSFLRLFFSCHELPFPPCVLFIAVWCLHYSSPVCLFC